MYLAGMMRFLLLLAMAAGLASCCSNVACDCFDGFGSDILLQFDTDSLQGRSDFYRPADLRAAYVVRYRNVSPGLPVDSIPLQLKAEEGFPKYAFSLRSLFVPTSNSDNFTQYAYRVVVPVAGRSYSVTALEVAGHEVEEHCCSCYQNTRKRLLLDGQPIIDDGNVSRVTALLHR